MPEFSLMILEKISDSGVTFLCPGSVFPLIYLLFGNRTIAPQIIARQDNCPSKTPSPEIVPQIVCPWTTGAQTIALQNNIDY